MKPFIQPIAVSFAALLLAACTDNTGDDSGAHILETREQALDRARNVEKDIADAARRQAEQIERSSGDG